MLLRRPQFDLVPPQTSVVETRDGGEMTKTWFESCFKSSAGARRSFTGRSSSSSATATSEVDLSTVRLSPEEDPSRHALPDITVTGRLRKVRVSHY
jgi:hypothetical protein